MDVELTEWQRLRLESGGEDDPWASATYRSLSWSLQRRSHAWRPPTDVLETESAIMVIVEVAGMRGEDFSITFDRQILTVRGHRADANPRAAYHQMEIDYGDFLTEIRIPFRIDADHIEATYHDGFLRVILPKASPKTIPIQE
ncbi:MAG TPA: Hsp20/alpha crystallin family protein [Chloroflexi bacterium]|nr:Hsp20/alpha crystallin family protein [Chloroflexota bacterium]